MVDTIRKNACDPYSKFKIADILGGPPFGVSFEGTANFLIDYIIESEIELRLCRSLANIAKRKTPMEAPASQTAQVSHTLTQVWSFLKHRESLGTAWLRPFLGSATEYKYGSRRADIAIGRNVAHG